MSNTYKDYKEISASQITMTELMQPNHSNFRGKIHGGFILSIMDKIAFACASKHSACYCVTASVDTVDFRKPIEVGELVSMKASINYVGRSSMVVGIRVEAENIQTGAIKHCHSSYFTMVAKDQSGVSMPVPGIILRSEHDIRRFLKCIKRKEMKISRIKEFGETDFASEAYMDLLQNFKVKIERSET